MRSSLGSSQKFSSDDRDGDGCHETGALKDALALSALALTTVKRMIVPGGRMITPGARTLANVTTWDICARVDGRWKIVGVFGFGGILVGRFVRPIAEDGMFGSFDEGLRRNVSIEG